MRIVLDKEDLKKVVEDWAKRLGYEVSEVRFANEVRCEVEVGNINPIKKTTPKKPLILEDQD